MNDLEIDNLFNEADDAIDHIDDVKAVKILKSVQMLVGSGNIKNNDPQLFQDLQELIVDLEITAFSSLPDEISLDILRNHYLRSFELEIPMENRITAKLFFVSYIPRDDLRKQLRKAILENKERLGEKTVGAWLQEFDQKFDSMKRTSDAIVQFLMSNPSAARLNPREREILKETLHIYDYLLIVTLPATGQMLNDIMSVDWSKEVSGSEMAMPRSGAYAGQLNKTQGGFVQSGAPMQNVQMTLQEALKKYEKLGEQHLSGNPIKLKIFESPVRPSIKNWISDYYENVDARKHDSIERGNYLFHSENARRLTTGERQKVGTMLRALDEESLVTVDQERQEMVFQSEVLESQKSPQPPFAKGENLPKASNNIVDLRNDQSN